MAKEMSAARKALLDALNDSDFRALGGLNPGRKQILNYDRVLLFSPRSSECRFYLFRGSEHEVEKQTDSLQRQFRAGFPSYYCIPEDTPRLNYLDGKMYCFSPDRLRLMIDELKGMEVLPTQHPKRPEYVPRRYRSHPRETVTAADF